MRCANAVVFAAMLVSRTIGAQDVCAGASAPKAAARRMVTPAAAPVGGRAAAGAAIDGGKLGVARGANMYPGSGTGPVPDVTDWKPRGRIPMGGELIVQGRGLVPGQLVALLGGFPLTPTAQSASEIRFKVTDAADASPLVVYNTNGQPRTLESAYRVYDPTPYVTRVVPSTFAQGDMVTICGTSLFDAFFDDFYSPFPVTGVGQLGQIRQIAGKFVRIGPNWLMTVNPVVSPAGDRITFQAGEVDTTARACNGRASCSTPAGITDFPAAFPVYPSSVSGALTVKLTGVNRWVLGPSLTWKPPVARISRVYGKLFGAPTPFVMLPTANTQTVDALAYVEGMNLEWADFKVGAMSITDYSGKTAVAAGLRLPLNASTGPVCVTLGGNSSCSAPLAIFGGPVITRMPTMPLALRTNHTIEGLNLLPPTTIGLTYRLSAASLQSGAANDRCDRVLRVVEHTANRIVFTIGNPANTTPVPADCASDPVYRQTPQQWLSLFAKVVGGTMEASLVNLGLYYLKP